MQRKLSIPGALKALSAAALCALWLAGCGGPANPDEGSTASVTLRLDHYADPSSAASAPGGLSLSPQGAPVNPVDGTTGVTQAELTVLSGGEQLYFDADGNQVPSGGVQLLLTNGSGLTLQLEPGTYDFLVAGRDDAANLLADGALLGVVITGDETLTVFLQSLVGSASLLAPEMVVPNDVIDVRLLVHPPGRTDLMVPTSDYTATFDSSAAVVSTSALGVRLIVECQPIDVSVNVTANRDGATASAATTLAAADVCLSYDDGIGVDALPPSVHVDGPPTNAQTGVPLPLTGTVYDHQTGIENVALYDGPLWLANATVDDSQVPHLWTINWTPSDTRDYHLTVLAEDSAGNESRDSFLVSVEAGQAGGFAAVSAGYGRSCGLLVDGAAYCWGQSDLGDGNGSGSSSVPVAVTGEHVFASISAGNQHVCGLTTSGQIYCWGTGRDGQLGNGQSFRYLYPVPVVGGHDFASVDAGQWHTCGVTTNGAGYCWGSNYYNQLGNDLGNELNSPELIAGAIEFASVQGGDYHSCGLAVDGSVYCWGRGTDHQLGNGQSASSPTPVLVSGGHTFTTLAVGSSHACALEADGTAYCWGTGTSGQLGHSLLQNSNVPVEVAGDLDFTSISSGPFHTCGVSVTGAAYCWGHWANGRLGVGAISTDASSPLLVSGGLEFVSVEAGDLHTCGVVVGGEVYCWGDGTGGKLGNGNTAESLVPVAVLEPAP